MHGERRWMMAVVAALAACGGSDAGVSSGTAEAPDVSDPAGPTIAAPLLPPPCDVGDLTFTTSSSGSRDLIVIITNRGAWCEANLRQSPNVDPAMEPDVWLDPGTSAELVVTIDDQICVAPVTIEMIGIVVNDAPIAVAIDPVRGCVASLQALYPA